jgi:hypothetical protein
MGTGTGMRRAGGHISVGREAGCSPLAPRGRTLVRQTKKGIKRDHSTTFRPDIRGGLPAGGDRDFILVAPLLAEATPRSGFIGGVLYTEFVLCLFTVG